MGDDGHVANFNAVHEISKAKPAKRAKNMENPRQGEKALWNAPETWKRWAKTLSGPQK
jgi:hypothetical protein